jgi:flagellar hook-associated protein 2
MDATSTTRSATSALITSLGAGSGVDMAALAGNLAIAQFAGRTDRLTARSGTLDRQISSASTLKSMLLSLGSSLGERVRGGDLSPQPQIANSAVARASLSGTSQPVGSYSLEVTALAKAQAIVSPAYAATPTGSGTLTIRFGTVAGATFTEDTAHTAAAIAIPTGATLADVANAINSAGVGVSAYVAQTTTGARLMMKGQEGAANGFIIEAAETPGDEGLATLAWNPAGDSTRLLAASADAAFIVDGLPVTAKSNSVTDVIPGVTLALTAANPGAPTQLTFANSSATITTAMTDLTSALNEIAGTLRTATDPVSGDLARDGGARALRTAMSALAGTIIMPNAAAGAPRTLADLGLSTQRDGSFVLDSQRLAATLKADPNASAAMFTNGLFGVYGTVNALALRASRTGDPGTIGGSIGRYTAQKKAVGEDQTKLADKQEALRAQLARRFAGTDTRVGNSRSTLSFLQNQIAAWNGARN